MTYVVSLHLFFVLGLSAGKLEINKIIIKKNARNKKNGDNKVYHVLMLIRSRHQFSETQTLYNFRHLSSKAILFNCGFSIVARMITRLHWPIQITNGTVEKKTTHKCAIQMTRMSHFWCFFPSNYYYLFCFEVFFSFRFWIKQQQNHVEPVPNLIEQLILMSFLHCVLPFLFLVSFYLFQAVWNSILF